MTVLREAVRLEQVSEPQDWDCAWFGGLLPSRPLLQTQNLARLWTYRRVGLTNARDGQREVSRSSLALLRPCSGRQEHA